MECVVSGVGMLALGSILALDPQDLEDQLLDLLGFDSQLHFFLLDCFLQPLVFGLQDFDTGT